jgi:hypothetical protein
MPEITASRYRVDCGWDSVPHLSEEWKAKTLASYPPYMRDARSQGIPTQGIGAVYPVLVEDLLVDPFPIPAWWPRGYALDAGWKRTAVAWGAMDETVDCLYIVSEYYEGEKAPALHAEAIKARGVWQRGTADAYNVSQQDGEQMIAIYRNLGLNLIPATKQVEAGIQRVYERMVTGRLKIFRTMRNLQGELRRYHRHRIKTETGDRVVIAKIDDHLMDAMRYLENDWIKIAGLRPVPGGKQRTGALVGDIAAGY